MLRTLRFGMSASQMLARSVNTLDIMVGSGHGSISNERACFLLRVSEGIWFVLPGTRDNAPSLAIINGIDPAMCPLSHDMHVNRYTRLHVWILDGAGALCEPRFYSSSRRSSNG